MKGSVSDTDPTRGLGVRLIRNLSMQSANQIVVIAIGLISTHQLAKYLSHEAYGGFTYVFTVLFFFLAINDLGLQTSLVREISQTPGRTEELVQNAIGLRLTAALCSVALGWMMASWLPPAYRLAVRVSLIILPIQAFSVTAAILGARIQIARGAAADIINRSVGFFFMMVSLWLGEGLLFVVLSLVAGELAGAGTLIFLTRSVAAPIPRFSVAVWRPMIKSSGPLCLQGLLNAVLVQFDRIMLEWLGGLTAVGIYGAAYRIPNLFERVPQMIMSTVFPLMSKLAVSDPAGLRRLYRKTVVGMTLLSLPMAGGVIWLAPIIIRVLLNPDYAESIPLMRVVILSTAMLYPGICAGYVLIALKRTRDTLVVAAIAAVVNLGLNFLWIPAHGAIGAAWATVAGFAVLCVATILVAEIALTRAIAEGSGTFPTPLAEGALS